MLFSSERGTRGLPWALPPELGFRFAIVGGFTVRRRGPDATDFYLTPRALSHLAATVPDAVISSGFSFPSLYAATYCLATRTPLVIQSDGTGTSEAGFGRVRLASRQLLRRLAAGAVGNSEPAVRHLRGLGFTPVHLVPQSTDLSALLAVGRDRFYSDADDVRVLCVSRLIQGKGVDRLLDAVAYARHAGVRIDLMVVGEGPLEPRLRAQATRLGVPTEWFGFVEQAELPASYRAADVFAFPTLRDTFGVVLLEAAATGLPIVASSCGGATEDLVEHRRSGLVVDPRDTHATARALITLARDPELRARLGRAAHLGAASRTPANAALGYCEAVEAALRTSDENF